MKILIENRVTDLKNKYKNKTIDIEGWDIDSLIDLLSSVDPSGHNKYLEWGLKEFFSRTIEKVGELNFFIERYKQLITNFHKNLPKITKEYLNSDSEMKREISQDILNNPKDINSYKSFGEIERIIKYSNLNTSKSEIKKSGVEKIYNDSKLLVVKPLTHEASCYYGGNTKWCTNSRESSTQFNRYSNDGYLIYFILKQKSINDNWYKVAVFVDKSTKVITFFDVKDIGYKLNRFKEVIGDYYEPIRDVLLDYFEKVDNSILPVLFTNDEFVEYVRLNQDNLLNLNYELLYKYFYINKQSHMGTLESIYDFYEENNINPILKMNPTHYREIWVVGEDCSLKKPECVDKFFKHISSYKLKVNQYLLPVHLYQIDFYDFMDYLIENEQDFIKGDYAVARHYLNNVLIYQGGKNENTIMNICKLYNEYLDIVDITNPYKVFPPNLYKKLYTPNSIFNKIFKDDSFYRYIYMKPELNIFSYLTPEDLLKELGGKTAYLEFLFSTGKWEDHKDGLVKSFRFLDFHTFRVGFDSDIETVQNIEQITDVNGMFEIIGSDKLREIFPNGNLLEYLESPEDLDIDHMVQYFQEDTTGLVKNLIKYNIFDKLPNGDMVRFFVELDDEDLKKQIEEKVYNELKKDSITDITKVGDRYILSMSDYCELEPLFDRDSQYVFKHIFCDDMDHWEPFYDVVDSFDTVWDDINEENVLHIKSYLKDKFLGQTTDDGTEITESWVNEMSWGELGEFVKDDDIFDDLKRELYNCYTKSYNDAYIQEVSDDLMSGLVDVLGKGQYTTEKKMVKGEEKEVEVLKFDVTSNFWDNIYQNVIGYDTDTIQYWTWLSTLVNNSVDEYGDYKLIDVRLPDYADYSMILENYNSMIPDYI